MKRKKEKNVLYVVKDMTFDDIAFITEYKVDITQFFKYRSRRSRYDFIEIRDKEVISKVIEGAEYYQDCDSIGDEVMTSSECEHYLIAQSDLVTTLHHEINPILNLIKYLKLTDEELETIMTLLYLFKNRLDDYENEECDLIFDEQVLAKKFLFDMSVMDEDEVNMTEEQHREIMEKYNIPY